MKYIEWDSEKNKKLEAERGISFEDAMDAITGDGFITLIDHPNKKKYTNQKMYIIELHGYAFAVPIVIDGEKIFLKTIFPSRKYTKQYVKKG